jgi:hypothetical protein
MLHGPTPQLIRIGVRNKGCAGLSYHLEYVDKPGKFDEVVEQDGVRVLIDSKALFSIIGSEMDWQEDRLRYVLCSIPSSHRSYISLQLEVCVQQPEHQGRMRMRRILHRLAFQDVRRHALHCVSILLCNRIS